MKAKALELIKFRLRVTTANEQLGALASNFWICAKNVRNSYNSDQKSWTVS